MTTSPNIAAELREIAIAVSFGGLPENAASLDRIADALEAQQAAPTDLTEWQRELMRLVDDHAVCDGPFTADMPGRCAIESHAAQMVQRVVEMEAELARWKACQQEWREDLEDAGMRHFAEKCALESRCKAAEKDAELFRLLAACHAVHEDDGNFWVNFSRGRRGPYNTLREASDALLEEVLNPVPEVAVRAAEIVTLMSAP